MPPVRSTSGPQTVGPVAQPQPAPAGGGAALGALAAGAAVRPGVSAPPVPLPGVGLPGTPRRRAAPTGRLTVAPPPAPAAPAPWLAPSPTTGTTAAPARLTPTRTPALAPALSVTPPPRQRAAPPATAPLRTGDAHLEGTSRTGKVQSKRQQAKFFADPLLRPFAHKVSKRGAAFKALPVRKGTR